MAAASSSTIPDMRAFCHEAFTFALAARRYEAFQFFLTRSCQASIRRRRRSVCLLPSVLAVFPCLLNPRLRQRILAFGIRTQRRGAVQRQLVHRSEERRVGE